MNAIKFQQEKEKIMIMETIDLLGLEAIDKVTGFKGVITSACFDLYGCIQVVITPLAKESVELAAGHWFDVNRVDVSNVRVMDVPNFEAHGVAPAEYRQGAAEKPSPRA